MPYTAVTMIRYKPRSPKYSGELWGNELFNSASITTLDNMKSKNRSPTRQYSGTGTSQPSVLSSSSDVYACISLSLEIPMIAYYQWQLPSAKFKVTHHIFNLLLFRGESHEMPLHGRSSSRLTWSSGVLTMKMQMSSFNHINTDFLISSPIHKQKPIFYPWTQPYSEHGKEPS